MGRKAHITPAQRQRIVDLRKDGKTFSYIAKLLKKSKTACVQAAKHFKSMGTVENKQRKGRRKTTPREDRIIHRLSEEDRHKTAVDIHFEVSNQLSKSISTRTVQRRLNQFGLMGRVARKKPFISKKNQKARLKWAQKHVSWTDEQWSKVYKSLQAPHIPPRFYGPMSLSLILPDLMEKLMLGVDQAKNSTRSAQKLPLSIIRNL